ncbi:MAG TPA: MerR family transcriptional regulator [Myxococcales bacterium]|nr:MerR family transcriptional regulator [Myxococcales bacterium]
MGDTQGLLKISELAKRAGVNRGTIQHYLREGLLPRPVKTHRNMAFYEASSVDRIRLIKDLQKQRFLPLHVIRRIVAGKSGGAQVKAAVAVQQAALSALAVDAPETSISLEAASKTFDLPAALIHKLEKLGFVAAVRRNGERVFSGPDVEVLAAIGQLKRLGITERAGFRPQDLLIYKRALEGLLDQELQTFVRVVIGKKPADEATKLARAGIDGATALLVALRKKLINDLLRNAGKETVEGVLAAGQ